MAVAEDFARSTIATTEFYVDQLVRGIMTATNTVDYSNCRGEDYSNSQSLKFLLGDDGAEKVYLREDLFYNLVSSRATFARVRTCGYV